VEVRNSNSDVRGWNYKRRPSATPGAPKQKHQGGRGEELKSSPPSGKGKRQRAPRVVCKTTGRPELSSISPKSAHLVTPKQSNGIVKSNDNPSPAG